MFAAIVSGPALEYARRKAGLLIEYAERTGVVPAGTEKRLTVPFATVAPQHVQLRTRFRAKKEMCQPVLVLHGDLDMQVPAAMDLAATRTRPS